MKKVVVFFVMVVFCLGISSVDGEDWQKLFREGKQKINQAIELVSEKYRSSGEEKYLIEKAKMLLELGRYQDVVALLKDKAVSDEGQKLLAKAYYFLHDYTSAIAIWERLKLNEDWQALYFYAKTAEGLNLYPEALRLLQQIPSSSDYYALAFKEIQRINQIDKSVSLKDIFPKEILEKLQRATVHNWPQAGAVIISEKVYTEVLPNNRIYQKVYVLAKILNERGKEKLGEIVIQYDSTYEKVNLLFARTITPDGRLVNVGKKHVRDVSLYKNFPLYSNARAMIISMPEVVKDSLIEYEVEIIDNKMLADEHLVYYIMPQLDEPVMEMEDTLVYPEGKLHLSHRDVGMQYLDFPANFSPKIEHKNGKVIMSWSFHEVPQLIPEPMMPSVMNVIPIRILSSFESWEQIYKWWWKLAKDKLQATDRIKEKVRQLIAQAKTAQEKAAKIYHYCAQEIRYVAVEYGKAGYEPHSAEEIFENKYGDCKDQAILLVAMLRAAGLEAYPVIIPTRDIIDMDRDFPVVMFNHAIAVVKLGSQWIFMDPTAETCAFGDLPPSDQGRGVLIYTDSGLILSRTPVMDMYHNKVEVTTDLTLLKPKGITGKRTVVATGFFAQGQRYWLKYSMPVKIKETLQSKAKAIVSDAVVTDYKIENLNRMMQPVVLEYQFKGSNDVLIRAGAYRVLPVFEGVSLEDVVRDTRKFPIQKNGPSVSEYLYRFKFPEEMEEIYVPQPVEVDTPWFKVELKYVKDTSDPFSIVEILRVVNKMRQISPEDYGDYKRAKISLVNRLKERVLLKVVSD